MIEIPFYSMISGFLFIGVRLSGLFLFAPFLSSGAVPPRIKAGLVAALSFVLYPMVAPRFPAMPLEQWPLVVFGELLVGAATGIATSIVFDAVQMAGQILSVQMGYSLISILDPQTQAESTVVATFHQSIAMLIFLRFDVHLWLLRGISESFAYLPPGSAHLNGAFVKTALAAGAAVFVVGVQLAAPVLSATFFTDIILGLLGRASPQLPVLVLGPAVKSLLGLGLLAATLKYWPTLFRGLFLNAVHQGETLLHLAR